MIKAIIFDCFGVLVGSGFKETYRQAGGDPNVDTEFIDNILGLANLGLISSEQMSQQICKRIGISSKQWEEAVTMAEQPNAALLDYIGSLKKKNYKTGILSNANVGTLDYKLSDEQQALFDIIVVSAEVGVVKPDPNIYMLTAEKLAVSPEECIFIDDVKRYCQAAEAIGMQAIYYENFSALKTNLDRLLYSG